MVRALLAVGRGLRSSWIVELTGAVLIVSGVFNEWGRPPALITAGGMLVLKAFELDSRGDG